MDMLLNILVGNIFSHITWKALFMRNCRYICTTKWHVEITTLTERPLWILEAVYHTNMALHQAANS